MLLIVNILHSQTSHNIVIRILSLSPRQGLRGWTGRQDKGLNLRHPNVNMVFDVRLVEGKSIMILWHFT